MSSVLVTGGAGFIGSNLVELLIGEGDEVHVLDNLSSGHRENIASWTDVRFVQGDVRDDDVVRRMVEGVDVVYHLAASVGNTRSIDNPLLDSDINMMGTPWRLASINPSALRKGEVRRGLANLSAAEYEFGCYTSVELFDCTTTPSIRRGGRFRLDPRPSGSGRCSRRSANCGEQWLECHRLSSMREW